MLDNVFHGALHGVNWRHWEAFGGEIAIRRADSIREEAVNTAERQIGERQGAISLDPRRQLIDRIVASPQFSSSARLCQFLIYVADCTLRGAPEAATEQQIGIRVFGRAPGYNSSEDNIVRSHARLLRQRLADYFAESGRDESYVVEIPKGHYLPVFKAPEAQGSAAPATSAVADPKPDGAVAPAAAWVKHKWMSILVIAAVLGVLGAAGALLWQPWKQPRKATSPIDAFWAPFLTGEMPLVIFSNALFTGDSKTGLRYATPTGAEPAPQGQYVDTYTGIGELTSVYNLTRIFDARHASFVLKRSQLVTWDEAQMRNLIFLGSVAENPSLRVLPATSDFTLEATANESGLVNRHPKAGEPSVYSRPEHPLTTDYAILALLPGIRPGQKILVCSGLTTFGTEAAMDYISQTDTVAELLSKITDANGRIRPFQAVVQTNIVGGVPMQTRLVTLRVH